MSAISPVKFPYEEFDLSGVRTYPLASRDEQGERGGFRAAVSRRAAACAGCSTRCRRSSPRRISRRSSRRSRGARDGGRGIIWGLGAHVIKTGLAPVLIDLMERGFVSAIATNGAGVIHDFELALSGATSEDVDEALGPGRFGMAEETGRLLNARDQRRRRGRPRPRPGGRPPPARDRSPPHESLSIVAAAGAAARSRSPCTSRIGTDIIHMHPDASGAALGEGSLRDFRYFVSNVARLGQRRVS